MNYYKKDSNPLIRAPEDSIAAHELIYTETGKCVKKIYIEDNVFYIDVIESVLNEGETMSNLTPTQLELFWKLSKTKLNKYYEDSSRNKRRRVLS